MILLKKTKTEVLWWKGINFVYSSLFNIYFS